VFSAAAGICLEAGQEKLDSFFKHWFEIWRACSCGFLALVIYLHMREDFAGDPRKTLAIKRRNCHRGSPQH